jgi:hypothetical protein
VVRTWTKEEGSITTPTETFGVWRENFNTNLECSLGVA